MAYSLRSVSPAPSATPRMLLPAGEIYVQLTGPAPANQPLTVYVLEGGGGFPASQIPLATDVSGRCSLPAFRLGPQPCANRLLVQADFASVMITVIGSYDRTEIIAVDPLTRTREGLARRAVRYALKVRDRNYPNAPVAGAPVGIEVKGPGGGWIRQGGPLTRSAAALTDASGEVAVEYCLSSREETVALRAFLFEAPQVAELALVGAARRPRLLSCSTAARDESVGDVAVGWLTRVARIGTFDVLADTTCGGGAPPFGTYELKGALASGSGDLIPLPESGFHGMSSLFVRPRQPGPFRVELTLPDYPDEPSRSLAGTAYPRLSGAAVVETPVAGGANYGQKHWGGVQDPAHGVEIGSVRNDVQLVGPNMTSPQRFEVRLLVLPLPDPAHQRLKDVTVRFKVRCTPANSAVDDPTQAQNVPGTISPTPGGGGDVYEQTVSPPAPTTLGVYFNANEANLDHVVEVTARVRIDESAGGATWVTREYDTTILARAYFHRPRVRLTRKGSGNAFVAIDAAAILPTAVVNADGSPAPSDPSREVYLEFLTPATDTRAQVAARIAGGTNDHPLTLSRVATTGPAAFTLFRSLPIVCHLETPDMLGMTQFTLPPGREYVAVNANGAPSMTGLRGYTLQGFSQDVPDNTKPVLYRTPVRPVAFVNLEAVGPRNPAAWVPRPRIELTGFALASDIQPIVLNAASRPALAVSGRIRDVVADITPGGAADIREVTVNGSAVPVAATPAIALEYWPAPYLGTFATTVELVPGVNLVEIVAVNLVGGTSRRLLHVELIDPRNDFAHPDASVMKARLRVTDDPDTTDLPDLLRAHYWAPHESGTGTAAVLPGRFDATIESYDNALAATPLASRKFTLYRTRGLENSYASGPVLLLPATLDPALLQAAEAAHVPFVSHTPGSRLRIHGPMPHPAGTVEMQNWNVSEALGVRLLVRDAAGAWQPATRVRPGDRFTIEANVDTGRAAFNVVELRVGACDRLGNVLPGDHRVLEILCERPAAGGWPRMAAFIDPQRGVVRADSVRALSRSEDPAPGEAVVRLLGGGLVQVAQVIGVPVRTAFAVDHEPARQRIGGEPVPAMAPVRTSALAGARNTAVAATGEMTFGGMDAAMHGRGLDAVFRRSYQSFGEYDGPMGWNWNHGFNTWLRRVDADHYRFVAADGCVHDFARGAQGFEPPPGIYARLNEVGGRCKLEWPGGMVDVFVPLGTFDPDFLVCCTTHDRARNRIARVFDQTGVLACVHDPLDQALHFRYDDALRVVAVGDSMDRRWRYAYHDGHIDGLRGDLKSVTTPAVTIGPATFPDGKTTSFTYERPATDAPKRHKLRTVLDPRGQPAPANPAGLAAVFRVDYDADGRIHTQTLGNGAYAFDYGSAQTVVANRVGDKRRFEFDATVTGTRRTLPVAVVDIDGAREFRSSLAYNPQGEIERSTTPMGGALERLFDHANADPRKRGNLRTTTVFPVPGLDRTLIDTTGRNDFAQDPPAAQPDRLVWRFEYEDRFERPRTATDPLGRVTVYRYDHEMAGGREDGNLVRLEEPQVTFGHMGATGTQARVTTWNYNNFGAVGRKVDPNGVIELYAYFAADSPNGGYLVDPLASPSKATGHQGRAIVDALPADPARSGALVAPGPAEHRTYYDARGERAESHDPRSHVRREVCNELGQLVRSEDAEGLVEEFTIDANDDLVARTELVADRLPGGTRKVTAVTVRHEYAYDRLHNRIGATIDATGAVLPWKWEYDPEERLHFARTPSSIMATAPGDAERFTEFRYNARGLPEWDISAPSVTPQRFLKREYDDDGHLVAEVDGFGLRQENQYDAWGNHIVDRDAAGNVHRRTFDGCGELTRVAVEGSIDGLAATGTLEESFIYRDAAGREVAHVDRAFRYDAQNQRVTIGSGTRVAQYEHDPAGLRNAVISPRGQRTDFTYTGRGYVASIDDHLTGMTTFEYDAADNLRYMVSPAPGVASGAPAISLERTYDRMNRVATVERTGKSKTQYFYDTLGRLRLVEDALGNRVYQEHDGAGRLVKMLREMYVNGRRLEPSGAVNALDAATPVQTMIYRYDDNGNVTAVLDTDRRKAVAVEYNRYDERRRVTVPGFAGDESHGFAYKRNGLLDVVTLPDGTTITHRYDVAGRIAGREVGGSGVLGTTRQSFRFDAAARLVFAQDEGSVTTRVTRRYDSLGNVWEDEQYDSLSGQSRGAKAEYDENGELADLSYPDAGPKLHYVFDPIGRLVTLSDRNAVVQGLANYRYDGKYIDTRSYPNDLTLDVYHYRDGRLARHLHDRHGSLTDIVAGETVDQWTATGFPEFTVNARTNAGSAHAYDSFYRNTVHYDGLSAASLADNPAPGQTGTWSTFDARGNLVSLKTAVIQSRPNASGTIGIDAVREFTRTPNDANQVVTNVEIATPAGVLDQLALAGRVIAWGVTFGGSTVFPTEHFAYDGRGNLARDGTREYGYDAFNRLVQVTTGGTTIEFAYDALGRRLRKGGVRFTHHGDLLIDEDVPGASLRKRYCHGAESVLACDIVRMGQPAHRYYLHEDRVGGVLFASDAGNDMVEQYGYDPYGVPEICDAASNRIDLAQSVGNRFLSQSHYYDEETKLYWVGPRIYHPGMQRMLQRDSRFLDEDTNAYSFARGNLQGFRDPSGHVPVIVGVMIVGAIVGAGVATVREITRMMDGSGEGFDPWNVVWGAGTGAVLAPLFFAVPQLGLAAGALGLAAAADEFHRGHYWTAGFEFVASVAPLASARTRDPMLGRSFPYMRGLRRNSTARERVAYLFSTPPRPSQHRLVTPLRDTMLPPADSPRRAMLINRYRKIEWVLHERARQLGIPPSEVETSFTFTHIEEQMGAMYRHVPTRRIRASFTHITNLMMWRTAVRSGLAHADATWEGYRYPRLGPHFAHEASHHLFNAEHGGRNDTSRTALSVFYFARQWISPATARLLQRSFYD